MANEKKSMSTAARLSLRNREKLELKYYSDQANDCTYGIGTFVHTGPCTPEELKRHVTQEQVSEAFDLSVAQAESVVRSHVSKQPLTQEQFNALVSFVYNVGGRKSRPVLTMANDGDFNKLKNKMMEYVYIHPHQNGHQMPAVRSLGLINRRSEEVKPFQVETKR